MDDGILLPALRAIDITPFRGEGGAAMFALRDNGRIAPEPLAVTLPGYFILAHLNGQTRVGQLRAAFVRHFGAHISGKQIGALVATLDEALFLEGARYSAAYDSRRREYAAADARDNRSRWPSVDALQQEIAALMDHTSTEQAPATASAELRGVIAPHLDYARGGPCYRPAYSYLQQ